MSERVYRTVICNDGREVSVKLSGEEIDFLESLGYKVLFPKPQIPSYWGEEKKREREFEKMYFGG